MLHKPTPTRDTILNGILYKLADDYTALFRKVHLFPFEYKIMRHVYKKQLQMTIEAMNDIYNIKYK